MERVKGEARQASGHGPAVGMMEGAVMRVLGSMRAIAGSRLLVAVLCMAGAVVARGQNPNGEYLPLDKAEAASEVVEDGGEYRWESGFESVGWSSLVHEYESTWGTTGYPLFCHQRN